MPSCGCRIIGAFATSNIQEITPIIAQCIILPVSRVVAADMFQVPKIAHMTAVSILQPSSVASKAWPEETRYGNEACFSPRSSMLRSHSVTEGCRHTSSDQSTYLTYDFTCILRAVPKRSPERTVEATEHSGERIRNTFSVLES